MELMMKLNTEKTINIESKILRNTDHDLKIESTNYPISEIVQAEVQAEIQAPTDKSLKINNESTEQGQPIDLPEPIQTRSSIDEETNKIMKMIDTMREKINEGLFIYDKMKNC